MKSKIIIHICYLSLLILFNSCDQFDAPNKINDPPPLTEGPVINSITPSDSAIAGVREITITGANFAANGTDTNWVFVGNEPVIIKSVTQNEIVIYRPPVFGDALNISVTVPMVPSQPASVSNYKLEEPVVQFGDFSLIAREFSVMELDKNDFLWINAGRYIYRVTSDGLNDTLFLGQGDLSSAFSNTSDLKFGPGGFLYIAIRSRRDIYRVDPNIGGTPELYITIPENTEKMDFDANGNIYTGDREGIFIVRSTDKKIFEERNHYADLNIVEIRIVNNYLYLADNKNLYRNTIININDSLTLGDDELLVNLNNTSFNTCEISSFNIALDGTIYLCLKNHPQYSLFVLESDGSLTPFYRDDILPLSVDQIIWGNGKYLYLNRASLGQSIAERVYRMGMGKDGAPYFGRNQ